MSSAKIFLLVLIALLFSLNSYADHYSYHHRPAFNFGVSYERLTLDPQIAERELLGTKANAFNLDFGMTEPRKRNRISPGHLDFKFGLSFVMYDDQGEFTQEVVDSFGYLYDASSDTDAVHLYFEGGPKMPFSPFSSLDLKLGYSFPMVSERSIDYCDYCYSEDINVDGGFYGKTGITLSSSNVSFTSQYKYFFDENNGLQDSVSFGISTRY